MPMIRRTPRRGPSSPLERIARRARRAEQRRLRWHFASTVAWLEQNDPVGATPESTAARRRSVAALSAYALAGRFPRARDPRRFGPIFVDDDGRRCAMGHLLEVHGAAALVHRIRRTTNLAYVHDLSEDLDLAEALRTAGLSPDEAARIQPGYWCTPAELCLCDDWLLSEHTTLYEGLVEALEGGDIPPGKAAFRVVAVHGAGEARVGDLVVGHATVFEGESVAVGEHYLLGGSFDPFYSFPEPAILDTTLCQRATGDFENIPATAPAAAAIDNILRAVACGDGLPPEWTLEVNDCGSDAAATTGAGGATAATSSSIATTVTASSTSSSVSSGGGAPGGEGGGGGAGGATVADGDLAGGRGGCAVGGAGAVDGALAVLVLGGAYWHRRRRRRWSGRARVMAPDA